MFFRLPRIFVPDDDRIKAHVALASMDDEQIKKHTHTWQLCAECKYVLCGCGHCHSEDCHEVCLKQLGA